MPADRRRHTGGRAVLRSLRGAYRGVRARYVAELAGRRRVSGPLALPAPVLAVPVALQDPARAGEHVAMSAGATTIAGFVLSAWGSAALFFTLLLLVGLWRLRRRPPPPAPRRWPPIAVLCPCEG